MATRTRTSKAATVKVSSDVLKKSVTLGDLPEGPQSGGIFHILFPAMSMSSGPSLGPFWTPERDWQLYQTIFREGQWANAIFKAVSKMASQSFEVDGDVPTRVRKAREMLMQFDAERGWVPGLAKHLQAFLLTGNGAALEIVHQTGAPGSKVLGLVHLDTFRVTRTGDPDFPAIYRDAKGREHVMKAHQVMLLSDMPDQSELWYGVGHCAAERAYKAIIRLEAIENYLYEKTTGKRPLAIHIVNGVNEAQLRNAVLLAKQDSSAKGLITYMGAAIVAMVDPTATPSVATIDLASLPDGFEAMDERKNAYLIYANAIGIDPQLLDPDLLASRAMGTGAQSKVIAEKMEGIGLSAWRKQFEHQINEHALDEKTTFAFEEVDLDAKRKEAETKAVWATILQTLTVSSVITSTQALQMGVDWEIIPEEFLPEDMTPDTALTDEAKPEGEAPLEQPQPAVPVTGVDGVLLEEVMQTVRSAVGSKISEARKMGQEEAARREAYKALQVAASALVEAETKDVDLAILFAEGLKQLAKSLATPAPVTVLNMVPEQKAAPITVQNVIEQPAIQVQLPLTIEMPPWDEESQVVRDEQGRMTGTRTRRTPVSSGKGEK